MAPEHIEVGGFIGLAAATGGDYRRSRTSSRADLIVVLPAFERLGVHVEVGETTVRVPPGQRLEVQDDLGGQIPKIEDGPWPAFPADLTSIAVVTATQAHGTVLVFEKMFESRLFFVDKLVAMGARIILCDPHRAVVTGPAQLYGERLTSPDIRAGMAMLIAALCAEGTSDDRKRGRDRPRLRADRRAPAKPRRPHRTHRGVGAPVSARVASGSGSANVATGIPVLDHLLTLLARSGRFELALELPPGDAEAEVADAGRGSARRSPRCSGPTVRSGTARRSCRPTRRSLRWRSRFRRGRLSPATST